ncbi:MAG: hypothetical protein HC910_05035 [Spirulinaceae cyanobacterium SM2_1_0]|nr:hypothetical protein [Spirulinaceae cyanobacterium SM2_1_0]
MDEFFKGVIGCAVLVVVTGIVGASLSGSERAFDLTPLLNLAAKTSASSTVDSSLAVSPPAAVGGQVAAPPAPTRANFLAVCPPGSIEPATPPLSLAQAQSLRQAVLDGQQFNDLIEVQAALGEPICNFTRGGTRQYRYLVEPDKAIDALQAGDSPDVLILFENFSGL